MMKKRILSRALVLLMGLALVLTMIPMDGSEVYADDPAPAAPAIALGSSVLGVGVNTTGAAILKYGGQDWYVISYASGSARLLSKGNIGFTKYDDTVPYENKYKLSTLKSKVDEVKDGFDNRELQSVIPRDLDNISGDGVYGAYLWPLSTAEAEAVDSELRKANPAELTLGNSWWLRSPGYHPTKAVYVLGAGSLMYEGRNASEVEFGIRPAFDLNISSVVLTSAASGGKTSASVGANALQQIGTNSNNEWKVTVKDQAHEGFSLDKPCLTGYDSTTGVATVYYKGAQTGTNEYISAVIVNGDGAITYYGRIAAASSSTGSVTINTQGKLQDGDKLYVFNEQYHGSDTTDYASELKEIALSPPEHTWNTDWNTDGDNHWHECSACGEKKDEESHIEDIDAEVSATCTEPGKTEGKHCSVCEKVLVAQEVIPATDHSYGEPTYSWAKEGEDWKCTATRVCGNDASHIETETVTATGAVKTAATCTEAGTSTYTATFINHFAFADQRKDVDDIPATDHSYGEPTYSWAKEGEDWKCTATRVCGNDANHTETETVKATSAVKTAATCTEAGTTTYTATFINTTFAKQAKDVDDIPATDHSYGEPTYNWVKEGEGWKCTATRVCGNDASHTETETVTATGAVKTAATCTEAGTSTYTATFTNTAFAKQTKDVDDIPAMGHYYLWGYSNDEEHIGICDYCGDEITEEHEYTYGICNICNGRCKHSSLSDSYSHNPDRHWKRCTYCMNVIEDEEHEWQTAWTDDETNHWHDCTVCGRKKDEENHTWDEGKVTKEPTVDEEGETTYTCTVCKAIKTEPIDKLTPEPEPQPEPQPEPEPTSIPYSNISGNGGAWTNGSKDALSFTFKRSENDGQTFDRFTGIEVDGKDVPEKGASGRVNYTAKSGSVIIELQPSYLETLSAGKHTLTVNFDDGSTTAEFTIKSSGAKQEKANKAQANQQTSKTTPKTGDESNILFWLLLMATACIGIVVANKKRRCQK